MSRELRSTLDLLFRVRDLRDERLKSSHRHVLVGLLLHRSTSGEISPSLQQLVDSTGLSRSTVLRAVRDLETWAFLKVDARGWHRSSQFAITLPLAEQGHGETSDQTKTGHGDTATLRKKSRGDTSVSNKPGHGDTAGPDLRFQQRCQPSSSEVSNEDVRGVTMTPSGDLLSGDLLSEDIAAAARGGQSETTVNRNPEPTAAPDRTATEWVEAIAPVEELPRRRLVEFGTARCERVCEVFVQAIIDTGWKRSMPRERWDRTALADAVSDHLSADGTIDGALAELRRAVGEWVDAFRDSPAQTDGWSTRRFASWLASARMTPRRSDTLAAQVVHKLAPTTSKYGPSPLLAEDAPGEKLSPEDYERLMSDIRKPSSGTKSGLPLVGEANLDDFPTARGLRAGAAR